MADLDQRVRLAAFEFLDQQRQLHGDTPLPREVPRVEGSNDESDWNQERETESEGRATRVNERPFFGLR